MMKACENEPPRGLLNEKGLTHSLKVMASSRETKEQVCTLINLLQSLTRKEEDGQVKGPCAAGVAYKESMHLNLIVKDCLEELPVQNLR